MARRFEFEEIGEDLEFMPLSARRALDVTGWKVSLDAWRGMTLAERRELAACGADEVVQPRRVEAVIARATPAPTRLPPVEPPSEHAPPPELAASLGPLRRIETSRWLALRALERYALWKLRDRPDKLARAHDEIIGEPIVLAHIGETGEARMVDVAGKPATARRAVAGARVRMRPDVLARVVAGDVPKGDVFAAARIAGIQAAKRTWELIPLCHQVALTRVDVEFDVDGVDGVVFVRATAQAFDRTGVEMEALVAASVASLTIYDMVKSADRWMTIDDVALHEKAGGRSGDVRRPGGPG